MPPKKSILIAGPDTGMEFGWTVARWQGHLRYLSKAFDNTVVVCRPGNEYLYADFAFDCIPYPFKSEQTETWHTEDVDIFDEEVCKRIARMYGCQRFRYIFPCKEVCDRSDLKQEWIVYGKKSKKEQYDILIHARKDFKPNYGKNREWPVQRWDDYVKNFAGFRLGCIGTGNGAHHILGTDDRRNAPLSEVCDMLASSKVLVGPSSGPIVLANMCRSNFITWTDKNRWGLGSCSGTNKRRYTEIWNPMDNGCMVYDDEGWQPKVGSIVDLTKKALGNDKNIFIRQKKQTNFQAVIYSSFNRAMFDYMWHDRTQKHPSLQEDWIRYRAWVFKNYCWRSILNQEHQDWKFVLICHEDAKEITDAYFADIKDDRFNLVYSGSNGERRLIARIGDNANYVLSTRIDSDDMYHKDAMAALMRRSDKIREWYLFRHGHIYDSHNYTMYSYRCKGSGPFHGRMYTGAQYSKLLEIKECSHEKVMKNRPYILPEGLYCVTLHGKNTTTNLGRAKEPKLYPMEKTVGLLWDFGFKAGDFK